MKNSEKYKTPQERVRAFNEFCDKRKCETCELDRFEQIDNKTLPNALPCACAFHWLELEVRGGAR